MWKPVLLLLSLLPLFRGSYDPVDQGSVAADMMRQVSDVIRKGGHDAVKLERDLKDLQGSLAQQAASAASEEREDSDAADADTFCDACLAYVEDLHRHLRESSVAVRDHPTPGTAVDANRVMHPWFCQNREQQGLAKWQPPSRKQQPASDHVLKGCLRIVGNTTRRSHIRKVLVPAEAEAEEEPPHIAARRTGPRPDAAALDEQARQVATQHIHAPPSDVLDRKVEICVKRLAACGDEAQVAGDGGEEGSSNGRKRGRRKKSRCALCKNVARDLHRDLGRYAVPPVGPGPADGSVFGELLERLCAEIPTRWRSSVSALQDVCTEIAEDYERSVHRELQGLVAMAVAEGDGGGPSNPFRVGGGGGREVAGTMPVSPEATQQAVCARATRWCMAAPDAGGGSSQRTEL